LPKADAEPLFPEMARMSQTGINFTNMHATTPLCGPSRACLYRSQYSHNTGIRVNASDGERSNGFKGGFVEYYRKDANKEDYLENDLPVWMKDAGYRTMLVGKYLHDDFNRATYLARTGGTNPVLDPLPLPGWDDVFTHNGNKYYRTAFFTYSITDEQRDDIDNLDPMQDWGFEWNAPPKNEPARYRTTVEQEKALEFLRDHKENRPHQPFFLNINPFGPHSGANDHPNPTKDIHKGLGGYMVDTALEDALPTIASTRSSALADDFNNSGRADGFARLPILEDERKEAIALYYRKRMLALKSVDNLVAAIRAKVNSDFPNTYIFLTSDNGFSMGHHRLVGKGTPTNRCTNIPCIVVGPEIGHAVDDRLLGHIDFAPTFVELAGGSTPDFIDGISFKNAIDNVQATPARTELLIENVESVSFLGRNRMDFAGTTLKLKHNINYEINVGGEVRSVSGGRNIVYTQWANGDRDLYDLTLDREAGHSDFPQITNIYDRVGVAQLIPVIDLLDGFKIESANFTPIETPTIAYPWPIPKLVRNELVFDTYELRNDRMRGFAEHKDGIKRVELEISIGSQYWDGTEWVDEATTVEAEVNETGVEGLINTHWQYSFNTDQVLEGVKVRARFETINGEISGYSDHRIFDTVASGMLPKK